MDGFELLDRFAPTRLVEQQPRRSGQRHQIVGRTGQRLSVRFFGGIEAFATFEEIGTLHNGKRGAGILFRHLAPQFEGVLDLAGIARQQLRKTRQCFLIVGIALQDLMIEGFGLIPGVQFLV